jgi:hypothetical protein
MEIIINVRTHFLLVLEFRMLAMLPRLKRHVSYTVSRCRLLINFRYIQFHRHTHQMIHHLLLTLRCRDLHENLLIVQLVIKFPY